MVNRVGIQALRGFFMGAADIVPGVSGGTIALLLGIYDELIQNIKTGSAALGKLARLDMAGFRDRFRAVEWAFLIPLLVGILIAIAVLASVIERLLEEQAEPMAGLFLGLVAASIVVAWDMLDERGPAEMGLMGGVGIVTFVLLGFQNGPVADPSLLAFFGAGAVAVCAMILPGVSGSFLLLMLGMYAPVLAAVTDRDLGSLLVFTLGAVVGLAAFSTLLGTLLERARDLTLAALIGLMAGSLRVLWPWPNGVGIISDEEEEAIDGTGLEWPEADEVLAPVVLALLAFALVVGLSRYAATRERQADRTSQPS